MTSSDEPMDDWEHGEKLAQSAYLREAVRTVLPALVIIATGFGTQLTVLIFGIFGVAWLPSGWIPAAVFYLCAFVAIETIIGTRSTLRKGVAHRTLSGRTQWIRRILSRVATVPLAYLAYRHLHADEGSVLADSIVIGGLWLTPVLLALLRPKGFSARMRTLEEFVRGGEKKGPEV